MAVEFCHNCGMPITNGSDYFTNDTLLEGKNFCSKRCVKSWLVDHASEEIVAEWVDDNVEEYTMEPSDPYDRYGVSPGDF